MLTVKELRKFEVLVVLALKGLCPNVRFNFKALSKDSSRKVLKALHPGKKQIRFNYVDKTGLTLKPIIQKIYDALPALESHLVVYMARAKTERTFIFRGVIE